MIIGGGLAGSLLASRLLGRGHAVSLVDDQRPGSASLAAAGLFNVITGRFAAKTWQAEILLEKWRAWLAEPSQASLRVHVHDGPIYRPFKAVEEYNKWQNRSSDPSYAHLADMQELPLLPDRLINPHGGILIKPCGWLAIGPFIQALKALLLAQPHFRLLPETLDYAQLDLPGKVFHSSCGSLAFDQVVCCEGYRICENPWFDFLRIIPNKGQLLEVEAPDWDLPFVLSRKVYVIPTGGDRYVVGATYEKQFADASPSQAAREELLGHLARALKPGCRVVAQRAGIRPTTPNRRPVAGTHPRYPHAHALTGFGSKGVLFAPWASEWMQRRLEGESWEGFPPEANVARFGQP